MTSRELLSPCLGPLPGESSRRLVVEDACFRMRITLGVVLIRSLFPAMCVSGPLRSGSGVVLK